MDDGEPFVTDAPLVWLRLDKDGEPSRAFLLDGSYLEYKGRSLYNVRERRAYSVSL